MSRDKADTRQNAIFWLSRAHSIDPWKRTEIDNDCNVLLQTNKLAFARAAITYLAHSASVRRSSPLITAINLLPLKIGSVMYHKTEPKISEKLWVHNCPHHRRLTFDSKLRQFEKLELSRNKITIQKFSMLMNNCYKKFTRFRWGWLVRWFLEPHLTLSVSV